MKFKKIIWIFIVFLFVFSFKTIVSANDDNTEQNDVEENYNEENNEEESNEEENNEEENNDEENTDEENTVVINLNKSQLEDDFAYVFNYYTREARDDYENRLYKIYIPEGIYSADDQLKVYRNVHIIMDNVVIVRNNSYNMLRLGNKSTYDSANGGAGFGGYGIYSNITIEGGTFDGNNESEAIIRMGHASNITLKNVTFKNVTNTHFVEFGAVKDVTVSGCTFTDFKGNFDSKTNYEALQIDALSHDHFGSFNPANDETPSMNVLIENNTFKNLQRGVGTHTGIVNSYFDNIIIRNNNFENITGYAIMATNYTNSDISNNTMSNVGAGIMMRTVENAHKNFYASKINSNARDKYYYLNNTISNNVINVTTGYKAKYSNVSYGIQLYGEKLNSAAGTVPKGDFRVSGVTVNNNTINLNTLGYGIWVQGAIKNYINENNITVNILKKKSAGGNGDGIRIVKGTNIQINGNKIVNNTTTGYDSNMNGITANSGSKEIKINNNVIKKARKYAIFLDSTKNNSIQNNTINKAYKDAINLSSTSATVIENNTITKANRDGIRLTKSTSITVKNNSISDIKSNGMYITGSKKISIVSNTIKSCKKYGIYATKKQISKDSKNKISKCKRARSWK